jgi:hypothetical protein
MCAKCPKLPAESGDVHVKGLGRAEPVLVPHLVHEPLPRDDLAHARHRLAELLRPQRHFGVAGAHSPARRLGAQPQAHLDAVDVVRREAEGFAT